MAQDVDQRRVFFGLDCAFAAVDIEIKFAARHSTFQIYLAMNGRQRRAAPSILRQAQDEREYKSDHLRKSSRGTGFAGPQAGGPLGGQRSTRSDKRGGHYLGAAFMIAPSVLNSSLI